MKKLVLLVAIMFATSAFANTNSGAAVTACKTYIDNLYNDDVSRKVKKIKTRSGTTNVKFRVTTGSERFTADCAVTQNGLITYTDGQTGQTSISEDD